METKFNQKGAASARLFTCAKLLLEDERTVGSSREYLDNQVRYAKDFLTHQEIADIINEAGKAISRQRITQIVNNA